MSISSSNRKAGPYTGNGVTVSFAFAFKVFQAADVLVVQTDLSGVETTKTLTVDYTVTLNANQDTNPGGAVTMIVATPTGYLLTLGSQVSYTQGMVLTNTGGFFPQVLNDMADRVVILVQQLFEKLNRALTLPFSVSSSVSTQLPSPMAGKVIGWRADGLGLDNYDPGTAVGLFVSKSATSGSAILPGGPTANRDAVPGQGYVRFNSNTNVLEWYNGASWVSVTDATALAAGLQLGGLNTLTKSGDQFLVSQDVSGLREGSCSVASGDLYTLLGGTAASLSMKYQAHNFTITPAGMFGPRDETGDGWLKVTTEGSQERYYYAKSGTAGVAPVAGDFVLQETFDYTINGLGIVPPGTIIDFAGTTAPSGYLACPTFAGGAQLVSRAAYPALFAAIGTTWGAGDGTTTFGLPWFLPDYAAVQGNGNVGTSWVGQVIAHTHTQQNNVIVSTSGTGGNNLYNPMGTTSTGSTGGSANLAAGARVLKCVKY